MLSFAGLWDEWNDPEIGKPIRSCTIIVTNANKFTGDIHDRMPVILAPDQFQRWLTCASGTEVLRPAPEELLQMWPVSLKVNRVGNDSDPTLIEAVAA